MSKKVDPKIHDEVTADKQEIDLEGHSKEKEVASR